MNNDVCGVCFEEAVAETEFERGNGYDFFLKGTFCKECMGKVNELTLKAFQSKPELSDESGKEPESVVARDEE